MVGRSIKHSLTLVLISVASILAPVTSRAETLADALAAAYEHSGLLDQNRALLRAADEDVAIAVSALRPIVSWSASFSRSFGYQNTALSQGAGFQTNEADFAINASLLLYDFGASRLRIDAAKEVVLATREGLIAIEQQVLLRAIQAYVNVRRESETIDLRKNNLRLVNRELKAAQDRFEVGDVTRTDVSLAEARVAASRASLAASEGALAQAIEEYRAAIGHKPRNLRPIINLPSLEKNPDAAKAIAHRKHPEMRQVQHSISAAEINVRRAHATMKPTVSLNGRLAKSGDFDSPAYTNSGTVSLDFGGPIYRGGELSARSRQAIARANAERANLHVVKHSVARNVGNALANFRVAVASIDATKRQVTAARVAFRGVREEASLGQRTTLDVLTAEQNLLDAETANTSAVADRTIAAYQILASQGLLTARHLGLRVQLYDPAEYYRLIKTAPAQSIQGEKLNRILRRIGE